MHKNKANVVDPHIVIYKFPELPSAFKNKIIEIKF